MAALKVKSYEAVNRGRVLLLIRECAVAAHEVLFAKVVFDIDRRLGIQKLLCMAKSIFCIRKMVFPA